MSDHGICPNCKLDFNGDLIWDTFYKEFITTGYWMDENDKFIKERRLLNHEEALVAADKVAKNYGATRTTGRWGKHIGIYDMSKDRTVAHQCSECDHVW